MSTEETNLAVFGNKLDTMDRTLQEVVKELRAINDLSTEQRLLKQSQDQINEKIAVLFKCDDARILWQTQSDAQRLLADQNTAKEIATVSTNVERWTNRAQGAMWAMGIIFTLTHAIALALAFWLFTSVTTLREQNQSLTAQILAIDKTLGRK